jgi:hypothetical protein
VESALGQRVGRHSLARLSRAFIAPIAAIIFIVVVVLVVGCFLVHACSAIARLFFVFW